MRITSGMLWQHSRLSSAILGNSVLNQLGGSKKSTQTSFYPGASFSNSLLNSYNSRANAYAGLGSASEKLRSASAVLSSKDSNNLFTQAHETGSTDDLLKQAKNMVNGYNDTMKGLSGNPDTVNSVYSDMLGNAIQENKNALSEIGITVGKDNKLQIDEGKFQSAGVDAIEKTLGNGSSLTQRLSFVSGTVSTSAAANASRSLSTFGYGSGGNYLSSNYLYNLLSGGGFSSFI